MMSEIALLAVHPSLLPVLEGSSPPIPSHHQSHQLREQREVTMVASQHYPCGTNKADWDSAVWHFHLQPARPQSLRHV